MRLYKCGFAADRIPAFAGMVCLGIFRFYYNIFIFQYDKKYKFRFHQFFIDNLALYLVDLDCARELFVAARGDRRSMKPSNHLSPNQCKWFAAFGTGYWSL
jgi:hypothetical protein